MKRYSGQDWPGALPCLREAARLEPDRAQFAFYLGVSALMQEEMHEAMGSLSRVVARGESPFLEESRFFLAKAHLRAGNIPAARRELQKTVELAGERRAEAQELLDKLASLSK